MDTLQRNQELVLIFNTKCNTKYIYFKSDLKRNPEYIFALCESQTTVNDERLVLTRQRERPLL